jgi:hypothetical protein
MVFLKDPPFNPPVSKVPVLGPSSGNPKGKTDPNSTGSIAANVQAMQDQAKADMLYDAPVKEGFSSSMPWIVNTPACRRVQGFTDMSPKRLDPIPAILAGLGAILILGSFL